jgi:hypothetical protein
MRKVLWTCWALALAIPLYVVLYEVLGINSTGMGMLRLYLLTVVACSVPLVFLYRNDARGLVRKLFLSTTIVFFECLAIGVAILVRDGLSGTQ